MPLTETQLMRRELSAHVRECTAVRKEQATERARLAQGINELTSKFESIDKLVAWARRTLGAIILAMLVSVTSLMVQNWILHEQTKNAATEAATKVANQLSPEEHAILDRLNAITPNNQ